MEAIEFTACVNKVQTMVDGGLRVIFDFDEGFVMQAAQLIECKRFGAVLNITAIPALINSKETDNAVAKGTIRKSAWKTEEAAPVDDAA